MRGGGTVGRFIIIELHEHDSAVFNEIMKTLQQYPNIKAVEMPPQMVLSHQDLEIHFDHRKVYCNHREVFLTKKEFEILALLARHPGRVFSRDQLYTALWNDESIFNIDEVVKAHIKALRKKLSISEYKYIETVWGVGYRFNG